MGYYMTPKNREARVEIFLELNDDEIGKF